MPNNTPPLFTSIQACLDVGATSNTAAPWVIEVDPGVDEENRVINQDDFPNGLQWVAVESPLHPQAIFQSIIDGSGRVEACIRITGSGTSTAPMVIGGVDGDNLRGLRLTGGTGANNLSSIDVMGGGGIRVDNVTHLAWVGSVVSGNRSSQRGGGVYFNTSSGVIEHCQVVNNTTGAMIQGINGLQGGGIAQLNGHLRVRRSRISHHGFASVSSSLMVRNRRGGDLDGDRRLSLCFNTLSGHNAVQGGGVAIEFRKSVFDGSTDSLLNPVAHLDHTQIRANMAWESPTAPAFFAGLPSYAGGGVFVQNDEDKLKIDTSGALRLYNNLIHENLMDSSLVGINSSRGKGGGVYLELQFGWSPNSPLPVLNASVELAGNAIFHNGANSRGGGLFYGVVSAFPVGTLGELLNNTIVYNTLNSATSAQGTGLFIVKDSSFVGFNNIIFYNESLTGEGWEWVWATPTGPASFFGVQSNGDLPGAESNFTGWRSVQLRCRQ